MIQELNRGLAEKNPKSSPTKSPNPSSAKKVQIDPQEPQPDTEQYLLKESPSKQKYIPSRYGVNEVMQSTQSLSKTALLNTLQQQMEVVDDEMAKMSPEKINNRLKEMKSYQPTSKPVKVSEFKSRPIKKAEMDLLTFKEIFVAPKEKVLHDLREKEKTFTDLIHTGAAKQYDKIIGMEKDESKNIKSPEHKFKNKIQFSSPKLAEKDLVRNTVDLNAIGITPGTVPAKDAKNTDLIYKSHDKLQIPTAPDDEANEPADGPRKSHPNERVFFEQQIQVNFYFVCSGG